jgi:hypothetical protein
MTGWQDYALADDGANYAQVLPEASIRRRRSASSGRPA